MSAVTERQVHFFSDGHRLVGTLFLPETRTPAPALVLSHGWSGAVNERMLPLAGRLAQAGYVCLAIDHRGFGGSEGPRGRNDPREQVRDVSHALTYLSTLDEVNPDALGVVGVSFGGAIAIASAAADERVAAVASIVGIGNAERWLRSLRPFHEWYSFRQRLEEDNRKRVVDGAGERVDFSELMPGPKSEAIEAEFEIMRNKHPDGYPLENAWHALDFVPEDVIGTIAPRAVCLLGCLDDTVVPVDETIALYEAANEPRQLVLMEEGNHGGPLGPLVEETAAAVGAFLDEHLAPVIGV